MKKDLLVYSLINFLLPMLAIYGLFCLCLYPQTNLFTAFFGLSLLFSSAFLLERNNQDKKIVGRLQPVKSMVQLTLLLAVIHIFFSLGMLVGLLKS